VGKRSDFDRIPKDKYPTPYSAVVPLIPHLREDAVFCEPCAGNGVLIDHLEQNGFTCNSAYDIEPERNDIEVGDATKIHDNIAELYITNPPWSRNAMHEIIMHLSSHKPTWLLFDADWMHTMQSIPYMKRCRKIVSVGRVKWMPGSKHVGMDNAAWYLFSMHDDRGTNTEFYGRVYKEEK